MATTYTLQSFYVIITERITRSGKSIIKPYTIEESDKLQILPAWLDENNAKNYIATAEMPAGLEEVIVKKQNYNFFEETKRDLSMYNKRCTLKVMDE